MLRKIIKIDENRCNGCGLCAQACHEGAIGMVEGKAKLLREDYCDGLGDCLPACPVNAITFEEREAPAYNEAAVLASKAVKPEFSGCPGNALKQIKRDENKVTQPAVSQLSQWPVQIKLVPVNAPYFEGANLLSSKCKYCNSIQQGKRGLWRACRHYKIVRQDKDSCGRHIPGRYARVSPQWCPKRPETNWRFTKRV